MSCSTLCDSVDHRLSGFPVLHYLLKFTQIHVHWVGDSIWPSHSLPSPSLLPSIFSSIRVFSKGSFFFSSGSQCIGASSPASILSMIFRVHFLWDWLVWSPCNPRDSQESSLAPKHESINSSVLGLLHCPTLTFIHDYWKNHSLD